MSDKVYDVVIIGGGPAGLSCAIYAARAKLAAIVLDRAPGAGAMAAATKMANYPGIRGEIPGAELLDVIRMQALDFGAEYCRTAVTAVDTTANPKMAYAVDGTYHGRAIVIASGSMGRHEKIEGEEELLGKGVSYCATCDAAFHAGKVAGVVGHNEVAIEEAIFLARFAREVHLVTPHTHLAGPVDLLEEIAAAPNIVPHLCLRTKRIVGKESVEGIVVVDRAGEEAVIPMEGVFVLLGGRAPITNFLGGAVKLSEGGCIEVDCNFATSVPGVYAVGDVTCLHPQQAIIASAAGVIAALEIDKFLSGRERARVDYM